MKMSSIYLNENVIYLSISIPPPSPPSHNPKRVVSETDQHYHCPPCVFDPFFSHAPKMGCYMKMNSLSITFPPTHPPVLSLFHHSHHLCFKTKLSLYHFLSTRVEPILSSLPPLHDKNHVVKHTFSNLQNTV